MFNIKAGELLTRVSKYELKRGNDKVRIDIHEVLAGEGAEGFFAIPSILFREDREVEERYIGCGNSEKEALEDCLNKIRDGPLQVMIPPLV